MTIGRHRSIAVPALPLILLLAACTSGGSGVTPSPTQPSSGAATSTSPEDSGGSAEGYPLTIAAGSGATTNYLAGEDGKTLYVFQKDTKDSGKSACNGVCATNWPPYEADELDEVKADTGVTGKLTIVTRDDGSSQLAYNGMPLYYFSGDQAAGDTKGSTIPNWGVAKP